LRAVHPFPTRRASDLEILAGIDGATALECLFSLLRVTLRQSLDVQATVERLGLNEHPLIIGRDSFQLTADALEEALHIFIERCFFPFSLRAVRAAEHHRVAQRKDLL